MNSSDPGHFDTLETLEHHLKHLRQLPDDTENKQELIERAERRIARRKASTSGMR